MLTNCDAELFAPCSLGVGRRFQRAAAVYRSNRWGSQIRPRNDIGNRCAAMAARDREDAQQERPTIKRPWNEEKSVLDKGNTWHRAPLPPVNAAAHHKAHMPLAPSSVSARSILPDRYPQDSVEPGPKRTKYEQNGYHSLQGDNIEVNRNLNQPRRPRKCRSCWQGLKNIDH